MRKGKSFLGKGKRFNVQRIVRKRALPQGVREIHVKPPETIVR